MIFSEALFDDAQASLERTSNHRFALMSSPLIPFVHCLAGRAGQVRPNYSLERTQDSTDCFLLHRSCDAQLNCYVAGDFS